MKISPKNTAKIIILDEGKEGQRATITELRERLCNLTILPPIDYPEDSKEGYTVFINTILGV